MAITIALPKMQNRVLEATRVGRRTACRVMIEGENVWTGVTMAFATPRKLRPKVCTKSVLDNFDEDLLRRIVHSNDDIQGVGAMGSGREWTEVRWVVKWSEVSSEVNYCEVLLDKVKCVAMKFLWVKVPFSLCWGYLIVLWLSFRYILYCGCF